MKAKFVQTVMIPVFLSLFVCYFLYNAKNSKSLSYFLNIAFADTPICIEFYEQQYSTITSNVNLSLIYTNMPNVSGYKSENETLTTIYDPNNNECLSIIMNNKGISALRSFSEPQIIDAHINGDIEIIYSTNAQLFEKQILALQIMFYDGLFSFGWVFQRFAHIYNHWIAQYINSYHISYDWINIHYTESDHIISSFVDDKYILYSHGIGYGPSSAINLENDENVKQINTSKLALDINLEQSAGNKMQYIVDTCNLKPGSKVIDVGGGWGSFPKFAVPLGIHVHTLTISTASYEHLQSLSQELNCNDGQCKCKDMTTKHTKRSECVVGSLTATLINFWELKETELGKSMAGTLDAIVCLGTIEHLPYYDRLIANAEYYLKPGGYLHVDGFGTKLGYTTNYFMQKYIYPGDSSPFHLSKFFSAWEKSKLIMVDVQFDRENYANTMYQWALKFERLIKNESHSLSKISKRSVKIFRLYLWGMTMSFQHPTYPIQGWRVVLRKPLF